MNPEDTTLEIVPPSATEVIERAQIDSQISTAKRYPRSLDQFKKRAIAMATNDEETAESCLYRRPVGMKDGKQQFAEGMSVRMAEIVGASYGNLRVAATLIEQTERQVRARGMAIDLESNFASTSEVVEATVKKDGKPYDERMRAVIAKAALAKARRDATFSVVPRALAKPVESAVRALLMGDTQTIERRRSAVVGWINKLGIDTKRVWAALEIKGEGDIGIEHLELLTGIRTAIKDNDVTIDEAFPVPGADGPKQSLAELIGKKDEDVPYEEKNDAKKGKRDTATPPAGKDPKSEAAKPTTPPPEAAGKKYTPEERAALLKEVETAMLDHQVGESKVMLYVHQQKLAREGQDEISALDSAVLEALRAIVPTLKKAI